MYFLFYFATDLYKTITNAKPSMDPNQRRKVTKQPAAKQNTTKPIPPMIVEPKAQLSGQQVSTISQTVHESNATNAKNATNSSTTVEQSRVDIPIESIYILLTGEFH